MRHGLLIAFSISCWQVDDVVEGKGCRTFRVGGGGGGGGGVLDEFGRRGDEEGWLRRGAEEIAFLLTCVPRYRHN